MSKKEEAYIVIQSLCLVQLSRIHARPIFNADPFRPTSRSGLGFESISELHLPD